MPGAPRVDPRSDGRGRIVPRRPDLERPLAGWRWWEAILVYLAAVLVGGFIAIPILQAVRPPRNGELAANLAIGLVELGVILLWLRRLHPEWRDAMGLPTRDRLLPEFAAGALRGVVLVLLITFPIGIGLSLLFALITGREIAPPEQLPAVLDGTGVALALIYAVIVAPLAEELFFRGCLFRSLRDRHGFRPAAAWSSLTFGLVHYVPAPIAESLLLMTAMIFTGLGLAWIYERRGTIVAPIAAHVTFNAVVITVIFASR